MDSVLWFGWKITPTLLTSIQSFLLSYFMNEAERFTFIRKSFFLGRWIRYGDLYPDRKVRLIRNGRSICKGSREHDKFQLRGTVDELDGDLLHFHYPSISSFFTMIVYFSDLYLQRQPDARSKCMLSHVLFRPICRFVRGYFFWLGFLYGFPGLFLVVSTSYSTFKI